MKSLVCFTVLKFVSMKGTILSWVAVCLACIAVPAPYVRAQSMPIESSSVPAALGGLLDQCTHDGDLIQAAYLKAVKRTILWKLRFTKPPANPEGPLFVPEEQLEEYQAIRAAQELIDRDSSGCTQYSQFSRTIRAFFLEEWRQIVTPSLQPPEPEGAGEYI